MKPNLLLIDDEFFPNEITINELGKYYSVRHCKRAPDGLVELLNRTDWSMVIVDMMMPVPTSWSDETQDGEITGLKILTEARSHLIAHRIPVLLFTTRDLESLRPRLNALDFPPFQFEAREKDRQKVSDIVDLILRLDARVKSGAE
ncbi:MAG TPA: hypothetical protein VGE29_12705 [Prosthecobacter sp.]